MICPICEQDVLPEDRFFYPIERPYVNLIIHKKCFIEKDVYNIIHENPQIVYNYIENMDKNKGKRIKNAKL